MKFSWKVGVGIVVLVGVIVSVFAYKQADKTPKAKISPRAVEVKIMDTQVDCSNALAAVERLICEDELLKQLDSELSVAFHNDGLWQLHTAPYVHKEGEDLQDRCIRREPDACFTQLNALQQQWMNEVRDQCTTTACLVTAYKTRITEINGQAEPLPSFRISTNRRPELCEAMLAVLNRTPRQQLGACTEHDFSGSPFSRITDEAESELQKKFEQLQHAIRKDSNTPFDQHWPETERQYQVGLRQIYSRHIDVDKDGINETLLEFNAPDYVCKVLLGKNVEERKANVSASYYEWRDLNDEQRLEHGRQHGRHSVIKIKKGGKLYSVEDGKLIQYGDESLLIRQGLMMGVIDSKVKNWIEVDYIPSMPFSDKYWYSHSYCKYWYNY